MDRGMATAAAAAGRALGSAWSEVFAAAECAEETEGHSSPDSQTIHALAGHVRVDAAAAEEGVWRLGYVPAAGTVGRDSQYQVASRTRSVRPHQAEP